MVENTDCESRRKFITEKFDVSHSIQCIGLDQSEIVIEKIWLNYLSSALMPQFMLMTSVIVTTIRFVMIHTRFTRGLLCTQ